MQITITGSTVQTAAGMVGILVVLGGINKWIITNTVRDLLEQHLKNNYIQSAGSRITGYQIEDKFKRNDARLKLLEQKVDETEKYTHRWSHTIRNKLTPVYLKLNIVDHEVQSSDAD